VDDDGPCGGREMMEYLVQIVILLPYCFCLLGPVVLCTCSHVVTGSDQDCLESYMCDVVTILTSSADVICFFEEDTRIHMVRSQGCR
jgi:hypothetical protein